MKKKITSAGTYNYYWRSEKGYYYMSNFNGTKRISRADYDSIK